MKIYIYISLPMTGYDLDERRALCERAQSRVRGWFGDSAEIRTPFDFADKVDAEKKSASYGDYMAEDIRYIIDQADMVLFLVDPTKTTSKGVRLEYSAAMIFGKAIRFYNA